MKHIFVGSSTEALRHAESVADSLSKKLPDTKFRMWTDFFKPSDLTFQAVEQMLTECCGAILLATPDDEVYIRGERSLVPRGNILLELGLVSARLGRSSVALCKYDQVTLPTDLNGFTYVGMGRFNLEKSAGDSQLDPQLSEDTLEILSEWILGLHETADGISRTDVVHGYSGRWRVFIRMDRWRNIVISTPSFVGWNGFADLWIPMDGAQGFGFLHGELNVQLKDPKRGEFSARFNVTDAITDLKCLSSGSITFVSQTHSRQCMSSEGEPWQVEGIRPELPGPRTFHWQLTPDTASRARRLSGWYCTEGDDRSRGEVIFTRE